MSIWSYAYLFPLNINIMIERTCVGVAGLGLLAGLSLLTCLVTYLSGRGRLGTVSRAITTHMLGDIPVWAWQAWDCWPGYHYSHAWWLTCLGVAGLGLLAGLSLLTCLVTYLCGGSGRLGTVGRAITTHMLGDLPVWAWQAWDCWPGYHYSHAWWLTCLGVAGLELLAGLSLLTCLVTYLCGCGRLGTVGRAITTHMLGDLPVRAWQAWDCWPGYHYSHAWWLTCVGVAGLGLLAGLSLLTCLVTYLCGRGRFGTVGRAITIDMVGDLPVWAWQVWDCWPGYHYWHGWL